MVALTLVLVIVMFFIWPEKGEGPEKFVWLTPAEAARAFKPGRITALKLRLATISASTWKWFMAGKTQMSAEARLISFPGESPVLGAEIGAHAFTNATGMQAWLLSVQEWKGLKARLSEFTNVTAVHIGITSVAGLQTVASSSTGADGVRVSLAPTVSRGSFNVLLTAILTAGTNSPAGISTGVRTNFSVSCRAILESGGALVVNGAKSPEARGTDYWFVLSVVAVDAAGNPRKLGK